MAKNVNLEFVPSLGPTEEEQLEFRRSLDPGLVEDAEAYAGDSLESAGMTDEFMQGWLLARARFENRHANHAAKPVFDGAWVCGHITGPGGTGAPPHICGHHLPHGPVTVDLIRFAINDPGAFLPRANRDDPDKRETVANWGARAVLHYLENGAPRD